MKKKDRFEQKKVWENRKLNEDPYFKEKLRLFHAYIPPDVKTTVDIGCGDGSITNSFPEGYRIVGYDASFTALKKVFKPKARGNCDVLAMKPSSFDLVLASELLEHLPGEILNKTVREIKRVAKKYILVSTPYKENLLKKMMRCPKCEEIFHAWGHCNRFSLKKLCRLFPEYTLKSWTHCGLKESHPNCFLQCIRLYIGKKWHYDENDFSVCPACGNTEFLRRARTPIAKVCDYLENKIGWLKRKVSNPYWIVVLFEKQC